MRTCQIIKALGIISMSLASQVARAQVDSTVGPDTIPVMYLDTMHIDSASIPGFQDTTPPGGEFEWHGPDPYGISLEGLSLRMITGHTTKVMKKGILEFCVQHRFGFLSMGKEQFYGLDASDVRLGFDYGITKFLTAGIGRSSLGKTFNGYLKANIAKQQNNGIVTATFLTDMSVSGLKNTDPDKTPYYFSHRLKYLNQLLISREFAGRALVTLGPGVIHHNLVDSAKYPNDMFTMVFNGRLKVANGLNLTAEYAYLYNYNMRHLYSPCIGFGLEIYTSGHIFQIVLSNSNSMNEADSYAMKNGKLSNGDLRVGFNIVRQF